MKNPTHLAAFASALAVAEFTKSPADAHRGSVLSTLGPVMAPETGSGSAPSDLTGDPRTHEPDGLARGASVEDIDDQDDSITGGVKHNGDGTFRLEDIETGKCGTGRFPHHG